MREERGKVTDAMEKLGKEVTKQSLNPQPLNPSTLNPSTLNPQPSKHLNIYTSSFQPFLSPSKSDH